MKFRSVPGKVPVSLVMALMVSVWTSGCGGSGSGLSSNAGGSGGSGSSGSSAGSNVVAYVFTVDNLTYHPAEFVLLPTGKLELLSNDVPSLFSRATSHSMVFMAKGMTPTLQSYNLGVKGVLHPQGPPVSYAINRFGTLATDGQSNVYAVTDEGIFGFSADSTGLTSLPQISQTVASPCSPAQENSSSPCEYIAQLMLGSSNALLLEQNIPSYGGASPAQVSQFTLEQGALGSERMLSQAITVGAASAALAVATPDNHYLYFVDFATSHILRYDVASPDSSPTASVLASAGQVSDGIAQLLISPDGKFLLAAVSDSSAKAGIRVFRINSAGNLSEVAGSPFSTEETSFVQMAMDPSEKFLITIHAACKISASSDCVKPGKLVAMSFNSSTGALAITNDVEDGLYPAGVTVAAVSQ